MSQTTVPHQHAGSMASSDPVDTTNNTTNNPQSNASATEAGAGGGLRDPNDEITPEQAKAEGLPEQKHAGAVGYGPDYANKDKATLGEKITGIKEQLVGKVTRNPEVIQRGHDRRTGELKRNGDAQDEKDPFATEEPAKGPALNDQDPGANSTIRTDSIPNVDGDTARRGTGLGGGKSSEVDIATGQSRLTTDPSHPAAQDEGVKRAAEI